MWLLRICSCCWIVEKVNRCSGASDGPPPKVLEFRGNDCLNSRRGSPIHYEIAGIACRLYIIHTSRFQYVTPYAPTPTILAGHSDDFQQKVNLGAVQRKLVADGNGYGCTKRIVMILASIAQLTPKLYGGVHNDYGEYFGCED